MGQRHDVVILWHDEKGRPVFDIVVDGGVDGSGEFLPSRVKEWLTRRGTAPARIIWASCTCDAQRELFPYRVSAAGWSVEPDDFQADRRFDYEVV